MMVYIYDVFTEIKLFWILNFDFEEKQKHES